MEYIEFSFQMDRLSRNYQGKTYSQDRLDILWAECRGFTVSRFTELITELIGTHRQPPMLKEFREMAAKIRERICYDEKQQINKAYDNFLSRDDVDALFTLLRRRLNGEMSHEEFCAQRDILNRTVELAMQGKEKPCCTDGMISAIKKENGNLFAFRCQCSRGSQYLNVPLWTNSLENAFVIQ